MGRMCVAAVFADSLGSVTSRTGGVGKGTWLVDRDTRVVLLDMGDGRDGGGIECRRLEANRDISYWFHPERLAYDLAG